MGVKGEEDIKNKKWAFFSQTPVRHFSVMLDVKGARCVLSPLVSQDFCNTTRKLPSDPPGFWLDTRKKAAQIFEYAVPCCPYGRCLLAATFQLLPFACCLLAAAFWQLPSGCYLLAATFLLLPSGCYLLAGAFSLAPSRWCLLLGAFWLLPSAAAFWRCLLPLPSATAFW